MIMLLHTEICFNFEHFNRKSSDLQNLEIASNRTFNKDSSYTVVFAVSC